MAKKKKTKRGNQGGNQPASKPRKFGALRIGVIKVRGGFVAALIDPRYKDKPFFTTKPYKHEGHARDCARRLKNWVLKPAWAPEEEEVEAS